MEPWLVMSFPHVDAAQVLLRSLALVDQISKSVESYDHDVQ